MKISNHYNSIGVISRLKLGGLAVLAVLLVGCASLPAPTEQMAVSKETITRATAVGGNEFAPVELRSAIEKMGAAEKALTEEKYVKARRLAEQAQVDAQLAETKSASAKAQLAVKNAEESDRILRQEIDRITP